MEAPAFADQLLQGEEAKAADLSNGLRQVTSANACHSVPAEVAQLRYGKCAMSATARQLACPLSSQPRQTTIGWVTTRSLCAGAPCLQLKLLHSSAT